MSLDPLRIYVHENGLVRFGTESYSSNVADLSNQSAYLTNFSINRKNPRFVATEDPAHDGLGSKWTHRPFWEFLLQSGRDPDVAGSGPEAMEPGAFQMENAGFCRPRPEIEVSCEMRTRRSLLLPPCYSPFPLRPFPVCDHGPSARIAIKHWNFRRTPVDTIALPRRNPSGEITNASLNFRDDSVR
jgi:hypothetical protein